MFAMCTAHAFSELVFTEGLVILSVIPSQHKYFLSLVNTVEHKLWLLFLCLFLTYELFSEVFTLHDLNPAQS